MKKSFALFLCLFICRLSLSQVSMQPVPLNEWMVNPASLVRTDFINPGNPTKGRLQVDVRDKAGRTLLAVTSEIIYIQTGITHYEPSSVTNAVYASADEAIYLRNFMILPTGEYNICYMLTSEVMAEPVQTLCNAISVTSLHSMMLVSPFDGEEIETGNPILVWSLINSSLTPTDGSHFELFVAPWEKKTSKERSVTEKPILHINDLKAFQVLYSSDMPALENGKKYVWQVLKIFNGAIVDKTDVWSFSLPVDQKLTSSYVELSREDNLAVYNAIDEIVLFRFDESYRSSGKPNVEISDAKGNVLKPDIKNTNQRNEALNAESTGFNQFKLDLKPYKLKRGIYQLSVRDEAGVQFRIRVKIN